MFSGYGGWSAAFRDRGHEVFTIDWDPDFRADICTDVTYLNYRDLPWRPDIVLASPPCHRFSVAGMRRYWSGAISPLTLEAMDLVRHTVDLIEATKAPFAIIENPRGMLRKLDLIPWPRVTVTYCQYGDHRMKPTDLWGKFPSSFVPRPPCANGDECHTRAPRGSRTGTQSLDDYARKAMVPYELSLDVCLAAEENLRSF